MFEIASRLEFTIAAATFITGSHDRRKTMDDHIHATLPEGSWLRLCRPPGQKRFD